MGLYIYAVFPEPTMLASSIMVIPKSRHFTPLDSMFKCIYHAKGRHLYRFCLIAGKFLNKIYLHVFFPQQINICFFFVVFFTINILIYDLINDIKCLFHYLFQMK